MAQETSRGASGEIELRYHWAESSSSHLETESVATLAALDSGNLILIERNEKSNFFKNEASERSSRLFKISVEQIIDLIEKHGERVQVLVLPVVAVTLYHVIA